jgi:hypothetical protein
VFVGLASLTGSAPAQDEDFCRAYAAATVEAAKLHYTNQCGGDENGRYSLEESFHYDWCRGLGADAMKWAVRETNIRAQNWYNCVARQHGVEPFDMGHTEYENDYPRPGSKFNFCSNYAFWVTAQRARAVNLGCDVSASRWAESFNFHRDWCMGLAPSDAKFMSSEINARSWELMQCQRAVAAATQPPPAEPPPAEPPPEPAGGNCTITADVDVYPHIPGEGEEFDNLPFIRAGSVVTSNQRQDDWYRITGANVPNGQGWVWGDFIACN